MFRLLRKLVSFILLLAIICLVLGYFFRTSLLSTALTYAMKTPVHVEAINFDGEGFIVEGLVIETPESDKAAQALKIDSIEGKLLWKEIYKNPLIVDSLVFDGVYFQAEVYSIKGNDSNWSRLMERQSSGSKSNSNSSDSVSASANRREVIIKDLAFTNVNLTTYLPVRGETKIKPISKINMPNVSSENLPVSQFISILVSKVLNKVVLDVGVEGLKGVGEEVLNLPSKALEAPEKVLEGIGVEKGSEGVKNVREKLDGFVKDLFK